MNGFSAFAKRFNAPVKIRETFVLVPFIKRIYESNVLMCPRRYLILQTVASHLLVGGPSTSDAVASQHGGATAGLDSR